LVPGGVSASLTGIAGWSLIVTACAKLAPRSGLRVLRYRVYQLVSTSSACRFVSRPTRLAPVAALLGSVRNASRLTGCAPFDRRYALMNRAWLVSSSVLCTAA
jgi:hypothetical protein